MPRSERRKALFSAFASKAQNENIIVLDEWVMTAPKTKEAAQILASLPTKNSKKVLHIHPDFDRVLFKSTDNLPGVTSKTIANTNIIDILGHDTIVLTKAAVEGIDKHFTPNV
jgi:large subunit ribosomal protein L4